MRKIFLIFVQIIIITFEEGITRKFLLYRNLFLLRIFIKKFRTVDTCVDPNRKTGVCVGIRSCNSIVTLLRSRMSGKERTFLRQSQCGWEGNYPKVCCADNVANVRRPTPGFTNSLVFPSDDELPSRSTSTSLLPQVGQCGVQITNKIFGGRGAQFDEYPWLALLEYAKRELFQ